MSMRRPSEALLVTQRAGIRDWTFASPTIWCGDVQAFVATAPKGKMFDLIITSPPYNIGKEYERKKKLSTYFQQQEEIIKQLISIPFSYDHSG
jgi:adenine-specific DNA-methyltransferase